MSEPWTFQPEQIADINAAARQLNIPIQLPEDGRAWAVLLDSSQALELSHLCANGFAGVYGEERAARLLKLSDELHTFATGVPSRLSGARSAVAP